MISPKPKTINNNLSIMNVLKSFPKQVHSNNVTKYLGTTTTTQPIVKLSSEVESDTLQEREGREQPSWILSAHQT